MALKLDISYAYDKVNWKFMYVVLSKMGFQERFINIIRVSVESVHYSVIVNGTPWGFFKPGKGLSGSTTGGIIIRDSLGNLVLAYVGNFDSVSSNMAKALALFWGLKLDLGINVKRLIIEGDSKLIIEAVKGVSGISWMINNVIKAIWLALHLNFTLEEAIFGGI
ncbi:uncharacterized protein LOC131857313 [Cryptomeria japonica]|uniref:uncharacterized protein LOC131857313 n=1 Tax=Cryptomeria japonica TaxID=3369 RepID=UPI0027DAB1C7|nr:uncharacterized protein LOC131857313 [Cryptomeria japonica]